MSLPRYPAYKDSGVEWLPAVPAHWEVIAARRVFSEHRDAALEEDEQLSATQRYGVIPQRLFMEAEDQKVVLALSGTGNFKHVQKDDFVISLRSFQGGIEWSGYTGCVSPAYTVLRSNTQIEPKYWAYVLKCAPYVSALQTVTVGIRDGKNISYSQFGGLEVPVVPLDEQQAIATFLDRETAKIDALIAEQERLLALLAEKRQATISRAVTRGLNPDAPMKDSGIPWLGEVPAHWNVRRLRFVADIETGNADTADSMEGGEFPFFVRSQTVESIDRFTHDCEAVLTAGDGAGVGKVFHHYAGKFCAHQRVYIFRNFRDVSGAWFFEYMRALFYRTVLEGTAKSTVDSLRRPMIADFPIVIPDSKEMPEIEGHIRIETSKFDDLVNDAEAAICLLKERRSALIAAAVTGKIDVRGFVEQEAA